MKKYKGIISVLLILVMICSFAACTSKGGDEDASEMTVAVTDENGEAVTDENGEVVTQAVEGEIVTDENGKAVTEKVTSKNGETVTNSGGQAVTQYVTKAPSSNKTTSAKTTTKSSGKDKTTSKSTTKASDSGSTTTTKKNTTTTTKPADTSRYITITVILPNNKGKSDTLTISVGNDVVLDGEKVTCDGSSFEYKTTEKYSGSVSIEASLKTSGKSHSVITDKDKITIDLSSSGIDVLQGDND